MLVMIEAYYKEGIPISDICQSLKRSRQTIYKVIAYLKTASSNSK
nr:helix-turn-helix domain-containing protein [Streptococcus gallolyticus]